MPMYTFRGGRWQIEGEQDEVLAAAAEFVARAGDLGFKQVETAPPEVECEAVIAADYSSIEAVRDIYKPWIRAWSGDEWGESLERLHAAAKTCYGLSDAECAVLARIIVNNVAEQREWMDDEGHECDCTNNELEAKAAAKAREARDYWSAGGNLVDYEPAVTAAQATIATLPNWLFEGRVFDESN